MVSEFLDWYHKHDNKVSVEIDETYGSNASFLTYLGKSSYEVKLATYCPIVVKCKGSEFSELEINEKVPDDMEVGFLFNLYDTFITNQERIIRLRVPVDKDFNELKLCFDQKVVGTLINKSNYSVQV